MITRNLKGQHNNVIFQIRKKLITSLVVQTLQFQENHQTNKERAFEIQPNPARTGFHLPNKPYD